MRIPENSSRIPRREEQVVGRVTLFRGPAGYAVLLGVTLALGVVGLPGFIPSLSLATAVPLAMLPFLLLNSERDERDIFFRVLLAIAVIHLIPFLWSPDFADGLRRATKPFAFVSVYLLVRRLLTTSPLGVASALRFASIFVLMQVALTVIFRLNPGIEDTFIRWPGARFLSGYEITLAHTTQPINVLFDEKAGGLFHNGNTASMFMAVVAIVYVSAAFVFRQRWFAVVAAVSFIGSVATGSKTALALAVVLPIAGMLFAQLIKGQVLAVPVLLLLPILAVGAVFATLTAFPRLADAVFETVGYRLEFYQIAALAFEQSPVLGLGYGGWEIYYAENAYLIGGDIVRLLHNFVLQGWAYGGFIVVVPLVIGLIVLLRELIRIAVLDDRITRSVSVAVFMAFIWVILHGMADNTQYYGDEHALPFLALGLGVVSWLGRCMRESGAAEREVIDAS